MDVFAEPMQIPSDDKIHVMSMLKDPHPLEDVESISEQYCSIDRAGSRFILLLFLQTTLSSYNKLKVFFFYKKSQQ